jgi:ankyrin repeat protein
MISEFFKPALVASWFLLIALTTHCGEHKEPSIDLQLIDAVNQNNARKVNELIALGASPNFAFGEDELTALAAGVAHGNKEILDILLKQEIKKKYLSTALCFGVLKNNIELCRTLVQRGAGINEPGLGKKRVFPIQMATTKEMLQWLLENKANINAQDNDGSTALHTYAASGFPDLIKLALKNGADPEKKDRNGKTPIELSKNDDSREAFVK